MPLTDLIRTFNRADGPASGSGDGMDIELRAEGERAVALYGGLVLSSVFQPIVDLQRQCVVGHEALLRATGPDGLASAPEKVFNLPAAPADLVRLDRLARTLHALNFLVQRQRVGGYLYLNVHPRHLTAINASHGLVFEAILKRCGLAPADIILEMLEGQVSDDAQLMEAVGNYRQRGYLIAVDNFGSRSDPDRLSRLQPEIVKLDRALVVAATGDRQAAGELARLVEMAHALSAVAVVEGIETAEQLSAARDAGANMAQGYLLGRPEADCIATHRQGLLLQSAYS